MAALIDSDASVFLRKLVADDVPGAAGLTAAVQEQDWAASVIAPFDVVEAHSAQDDVMVLGRRERTVGQARQLEAETMVFRIVEKVQVVLIAHDDASCIAT